MENYSTVYPVGNGKIVVYEDGIQIRDMFGPFYSSPTFIRMSLTGDLVTSSKRKKGSAVREHTIYNNDVPCAQVIDYTEAEKPVFYRRIKSSEFLEFVVRMNQGVRCDRLEDHKYICEERDGHIFAQMYPVPQPLFAGIETDKDCRMYIGQPLLDPDTRSYSFEEGIDRNDVGKFWRLNEYEPEFLVIQCPPGEHCIMISFGCDWREVDAMRNRSGPALQECIDWWRKELEQAEPIWVPEKVNKKYKISDLAENIAVMLICQQGRDASTISGYMHRMGYIRDQYGAFRGFLKLGYIQRAKQIIDFNYRIFRQYGVLHTAQAIGYDGVFHCHENDEAELTGYVILEAFDYLRKTQDTAYVTTVFPMLKWALETQIHAISRNMLPFNGDETYIAGGLLPRCAIHNGSAETTMQFIVSADQLLKFAGENRLFTSEEYFRYEKIVEEVKRAYRDNFIEKGVLYANNPIRQTFTQMPLFRHGVCEKCNRFTWLKKNANGRYQCHSCWEKPLDQAEAVRYQLPSVSLNTVYIGGAAYTDSSALLRAAEEIADDFIRTGEIKSSPVSELSVGYEFGLLLYTLTWFKSEKAHLIFDEMLKALDRDGTWGEYYKGRRCVSARCRPWESGINIEAVFFYLETFLKENTIE